MWNFVQIQCFYLHICSHVLYNSKSIVMGDCTDSGVIVIIYTHHSSSGECHIETAPPTCFKLE